MTISLISNRIKLTIFSVAITVITLYPYTVAYAAVFAPPPEISGREKAHLNITFTGGGDSGGGAGSENCTSEEGLIGTLSKDFSLGKTAEERWINFIKYFMSTYDLTPEQAAGPLGNFMWESGGKDIPPDVNQNSKQGAPPDNSLLGYGWAQWSGSRKTEFVKFMNQKGYVTTDGRATDAADMAFLVSELNGSYKSTITELKKQKSPEDAAVSFEDTYENAGEPELENRKKYAREAFEAYKNSSGGTSTFTSSCGGTASSVNFGEVIFPLVGSKKTVLNPEIFRNNTTDLAGHPYLAHDISAEGGTKVRAFMPGKVSYLFTDTCNGNSAVIWNEEKKIAISYLHMQPGSILPKMNQEVALGETIGQVGKNLTDCNGDHLHIDASIDKIRQPCSRSDCPSSARKNFRFMGKELYETFQALPEN